LLFFFPAQQAVWSPSLDPFRMGITLENLKVIRSIIKAYKNGTDNNIVGILKKKIDKKPYKKKFETK
jgi:hypothetical protein